MSRRCAWPGKSCWSAGHRASVAETWSAQAELLLSVPAVYHRLLETGLAKTVPFRALRHFVSAGERCRRRSGRVGGSRRTSILDGLGCSECVYMIIATRRCAQTWLVGQAMRAWSFASSTMPARLSGVRYAGAAEVRMPSTCEAIARPITARRAAAAADRAIPAGWLVRDRDEYLRDAEGFYHHRGRTGDMLRVLGHLGVALGDRGCACGPSFSRRECGRAGRE